MRICETKMPVLTRNVPTLLQNRSRKPVDPVPSSIEDSEDITRLPNDSEDDSSSNDEDYFRASDLKPSLSKAKIESKAVNSRDSAAEDKKSPTDTVQAGHQRRPARQAESSTSRKRAKSNDESIEDDYQVTSKKAKTKGTAAGLDVGQQMDAEKSLHRHDVSRARYGKKGKVAARRKFATSEKSEAPESTPKFKMPQLELDEPSPAPKFRYPPRHPPSESSLSELQSSIESHPAQPQERRRSQKWLGKRGKNAVPKRKASPEASAQKPQFKMHLALSEYEPTTELFDVDTTPTEKPTREKRVLDPGMALCPWCEEQVDEELLNKFSKGKRMAIARQSKFCQMHKRKSAEETWVQRGYPNIDWAHFGERFENHHNYIEGLIRGEPSYYGDQLQEKIKAGKNRTLLKTDDYPTPGYYGLRGMSIMTEALIETFAPLIRERAPQDKLISGRGYTGFVHSVLVPELAVKLVQEDLSLGIEEARKTVEESRHIGEILNDDNVDWSHFPRAPAEHGDGTAAEKTKTTGDEDIDEFLDKTSSKTDPEHHSDSDPGLSSISSSGEFKGRSKAVTATVLKQGMPAFLKKAVAQARGQKTIKAMKDDESDSDLSSIGSIGDLGAKSRPTLNKPRNKPVKRNTKDEDSDSELSSLSSVVNIGSRSKPVLAKATIGTLAHEADDNEDGDSDLASVGDL